MQLVVGRIGRPHGVRGDVTVEVRTDDPELRFAAGTPITTDPADRGPLVVAGRRWHKGVLLLTFEGVADRDAAEELRGTMLVIDSSEVTPSDDPDEFHDHQLIGLAVQTVSGEPVGEVTDVLHHGQDLLVVRRKGQEEALIPFVRALVPEVDVEAGRLVVDPPEGLL
ncbi:ribosome maturation factor RimM [Nonomuraea gerenzanensis]|uniref:Ribosome maturation factor RimM n=1 Tax=Nonomuraea gerenzanensis TaxID=93944 RepID=A0A1M4E2K4_9ACTN|nr:ribosome maturation factor RimM [Nonomuraea gerenzanensis]UBU15315.1 ribosome maturation factor RimM [Nonomuraea gerenzanensis]SBO93061.1 16S rRNA processing protein RimM [Nonomuraea gerenzanensis]